MYEEYKKARNKSWEVLLKSGINKLPVDLKEVAKIYKIKLYTYTNTTLTQIFKPDVLKGDGFTTKIDNTKVIFLNDKINNRNRRRFTMAHELGHAILDHNVDIIHFRNSELDNQDDLQEFEANIFARDLLMPAVILAELNVKTSDEIINICHVSKLSAEIRLKRLNELYKRNAFNLYPTERKLKAQFEEYINNHKK